MVANPEQAVTINRFITGLYTHRSPLLTPFTFTGLQLVLRQDALLDGLNAELTDLFTVRRRCGFSPYCAAALGAGEVVRNLYSFKHLDGTVQVLADLTQNVSIITPTSKTVLKVLSDTTKRVTFQSVADTLYGSNGPDQFKVVDGVVSKMGIAVPTKAPNVVNSPTPCPYPSRAASTYYSQFMYVVDSNNNIQQLTTEGATGTAQPTWATAIGAETSDGTAKWTNRGPAARQANHAYAVGDVIAVTYFVTIMVPVYNYEPQPGLPYKTDPYDQTEPRVTYEEYTYSRSDFFQCSVAGVSGNAAPEWDNGAGVKVVDGTVTWVNKGAQLHWTDIGASTNLSTATVILDSNGNLQKIYGKGKTGASAPTWNTNKYGSTVDGAVTWINQGPWSSNAEAPAAWMYAYAYKNSLTGHVCSRSPSSAITLAPNSYITVQGEGSSDPQVDKVQIYRTKQGGSEFYLLAEIDHAANWSFSDMVPDSGLDVTVTAAIINDPPSEGLTNLCFHMGRMWGSVDNAVYYASGPDTILGVPEEAWDARNYFLFPGNVVALMPSQEGLLVFLHDDVYRIVGTDSSSFYSQLLMKNMGVANPNAIATDGDSLYIYTSLRQLWKLDDKKDEIGFNVTEVLSANFAPETTALAVHRAGINESALYVCSGTDKMLRWSINTQAWSPLWAINGGMNMIASVRVSDGTYKLLGANTTNVLMRDPASFTDCGVGYSWFITLGSLDVAPEGRVTDIDYITCQLAAGGSIPQVSILPNEISGPFSLLSDPANEPPQLPQGNSLKGYRFYLTSNQSQMPTIMQYLQVKLAFPAEAYANELLEIGIVPKGMR